MDAVTLAMIKGLGGSGGSSLPSVTSSDNGKVLAVENGAWAAVANIVPITFTYNENNTYGSYDIISVLPDALSVSFSGGPYDLMDNVVFRRFGKAFQIYPIYQGTMLVGGTTSIYTFTAYVSLALSGETYSVNFINDDTIKTNKYLVTLTPTALDYSGTMDKTVAEIWNAHNSGQYIVFRFMMGETEYYDIIPNLFQHVDGVSYGGISASAIIATNTFAEIRTVQSVSDGTVNNYYAHIYALTQAS